MKSLYKQAIVWQLFNIVNALILFVTLENSQDIAYVNIFINIELVMLFYTVLKSIITVFQYTTSVEVSLIMRGKL